MTRAPGPAGHDPDERDTVVLSPLAPPAPHPAAGSAVPEVPAIADLAAPGRPDVDAVVPPEPEPARRRPRPSRRMRARADEMAALLDRAAPAVRRRRGLSSVPAAAAVLGAVAVGGVGIALGLDAQQSGQELALPDAPTVPDDPGPAAGTDGGAATGVGGRGPGLTVDPGPAVVAGTSSVAAPQRPRAPRAASAPSRDTDAYPGPTGASSVTSSSRSRPTSPTTPRSTSTRPSPRSADDGPDGDTDGNGDRGGVPDADLPSDTG